MFTYIIIYLITLTFALISYKKYRNNLYLKLFLYFLIYSFLTEIIGTFIISYFNVRANLIYNTWWLLNSIFYMFFFLSKIKKFLKRNLIIGLIIVFVIYNIINIIFFKNYKNQILIDSFIVGCIFIVITVMMYYTEILNSNAILNIKKSIYFWISIGVLIFNIGMIPVFVIAELIDYSGVFKYIILGLNILMASSFITGFIVSKKEYNV